VNEGVKAELEAISERRKLEMAEFDTQREAQREKVAFQRMLRSARDEALWLEQRPKVVADIRSGAAALRETSARIRTNRATRKAAKTDANSPWHRHKHQARQSPNDGRRCVLDRHGAPPHRCEHRPDRPADCEGAHRNGDG
jgi:hypothetical protein